MMDVFCFIISISQNLRTELYPGFLKLCLQSHVYGMCYPFLRFCIVSFCQFGKQSGHQNYTQNPQIHAECPPHSEKMIGLLKPPG